MLVLPIVRRGVSNGCIATGKQCYPSNSREASSDPIFASPNCWSSINWTIRLRENSACPGRSVRFTPSGGRSGSIPGTAVISTSPGTRLYGYKPCWKSSIPETQTASWTLLINQERMEVNPCLKDYFAVGVVRGRERAKARDVVSVEGPSPGLVQSEAASAPNADTRNRISLENAVLISVVLHVEPKWFANRNINRPRSTE